MAVKIEKREKVFDRNKKKIEKREKIHEQKQEPAKTNRDNKREAINNNIKKRDEKRTSVITRTIPSKTGAPIQRKHIVLTPDIHKSIKKNINAPAFHREFKDRERIFVMLPGLSLENLTDKQIRSLKKEYVICVNRAYAKFERANLIVYGDKVESYRIQKFYKDKNFRPKLMTRPNTIYNNTTSRFPEPLEKDFVKSVEYWFETTKNKLYGNITSIWLLQLLEGYKGKIYLLGCDFYVNGEKFHFEDYDMDYYKQRNYAKRLSGFLGQWDKAPCINNLDLINLNEKSRFRKCKFDKIENVLK